MKGFFTTLAGLASLSTSALAAAVQSYSSNPGSDGVNLQYLQVANGSNTDLRLRMAAPTARGWAAVAVGKHMSGSLFFVMHPSSDGSKATVSIRTTQGHRMPAPIEGISYSVANSSVSDGVMKADITCHGCTTWSGGSLDTMSASQPFIWAKGPGSAVNSDAMDATIQMHSLSGGGYGHFTINTAESQFSAQEAPATSFFPTGAATTDTTASQPSGDSEAALEAKFYKLVHVHATLFCLAWLLFAPAALWLLRFGSVRLHYIMQAVTMLLVIPAFGVAVYMSTLQDAFSKYDTFHQIIGITVFSAAMLQVIVGTVQHAFFKKHVKSTASVTSGSDNETQAEKSGAKAPRVGSVDSGDSGVPKPFYLRALAQMHMWFGRGVMILGAVNAPLGFYLVSEYAPMYLKYSYATGIPAIFTVGFTIVAVGIIGCTRKRKQY